MDWFRGLRWIAAALNVVLVVALVGVLLDAQHTKAAAEPISPAAIDTELALVYHSELLNEGFDYEPSVSCSQSGSLAFTCVASMQTVDAGVLQTTFQVACSAQGTVPGQRCWTNTGEALQ